MALRPPPIKIAVLDLYNNKPNEGMRALKELLVASDRRFYAQPLLFEVFETRYKAEMPSLGFDIYISSGGPGSPFDGEGKPWEVGYFNWLDAVWNHNQRHTTDKKQVLFICHSFQMMCRFFEVAQVIKRHTPSFGIFPIDKTPAGEKERVFSGLPDPFYAADFRTWQVVQPMLQRIEALGAEVLAVEKARPHVPLERATMAIRIAPELLGVQFHPEADPSGMDRHFRNPERRKEIIENHGAEKYGRILHRLEAPNFLKHTYNTIIPNFVKQAIAVLRPTCCGV